MELENQVVSLELAKRLKELGVKQDSICQLVRFSDRPDGTEHYVLDMLCRMGQNGNETYSAFTVAELLNLLDEEVTIPKVENIADYLAEKICSKLMQ